MLRRFILLGMGLAGLAYADPVPNYTLADCLDLAVRQNADVQVARRRLEEAAGSVVEARAGYLPSLTSSAVIQGLEERYANLGGSLPQRRDYLWNINIRLTETVYSAGAVAGRLQMARLQQESRLLDYQVTLDRVVMETRIAFFQILQDKAQVTVRQQAVQFLDGELTRQKQRLEVGTGDRLQTVRAEVSLALEKAGLIDAENRFRNSVVRLSELLAIPYSTAETRPPFEVRGELIYEKTVHDPRHYTSQALALRPELKIRSNEIAVQRQQLVVDRSALRPRVDVFAGYELVSEPDPLAKKDFYNGYVAGLAVTWQWFDGWATKGRLRATQAKLDAAQIDQEATVRTIQAEVIRACSELRQAEETIQTQLKNVALAGESLKLAQTNVSLGTSTQLDVLQARLDLTRAQTTELGARFAYNVALARLQRAVSSRFTILDERRSFRP